MYAVSWADFTGLPAGTPVLAFVTTIHCALTVLRQHRSEGAKVYLVVAPSILFTLFPWVLSTPAWLIAGLATHFAWFAACESLLPRREAPPAPRPAPKAMAPAATRTAEPPPRAPAPARGGFHEVRVLATFDETPEIRTFRLERPASLTFKPGQFVIVRVAAGGKTLSRCYSVCTAPSCGGYFEISVRRQGVVSGHLHETLRTGSTLQITGPGGAFVYPAGSRPMVLLAGGIGITPLLAMLRHGLATEPARRIALVLSAKTEEFVPYRDELRLLERRHPSFRLAITLTGPGAPAGFHHGRIDAALLEEVAGDVRGSEYLICGPLPMIEEMRRLLGAMEVPAAQVHFEKFETATAAAAAASESADQARLTFSASGKSVAAKAGKTILDLAEGAGVAIDSMCRAGVCGTCRTRVTAGRVEGDFDALDHADRAAGWVLACVARPSGNCTVEA